MTEPAALAPRATSWHWPALCGVFALASLVAWFAGSPPDWQWRAASWAPRPWTLWTSAWVHLNGAHLTANVLALGAIAVLGRALDAGPSATAAWLLAWPIGTLALLVWPQVTSYSGLSGPIHAAVGVLWSFCAMKKGAKAIAFVLLCGLGLKLLTERAWLQPVVYSADWGFNVVVAAHLGSAVCGALLGLASGLASQVTDFLHQRRG